MGIARFIAFICVTAVLLGPSLAIAEKRVALVIGNGTYDKAGRLANPTNDAKAISGMLQSAGFDNVALYENLGIRPMRQAINEFADLARDADTAVVYYSGHGMEVNGINYLIPVDAVLDRDTDVPFEAVSLDFLVQTMEPARRLRLVMLDACRNNPFVRTMKRTVGSRAASRGLAPVEPTSVNTLVAYAAKAGSYALDGSGDDSPYAIALLNHLPTPGLDLRIAFGRVRDEVLEATKNQQEPFVYGSLGGGTVSIVEGSAPASNMPIVQTPVLDRATQAWLATKDTTSIAILEDFIRQYGSTPYGSMARARLEELKKNQLAVSTPSPQPQTIQPAPPPMNDAAERIWPTIRDTTSIAILEDFIRQFGSTPYGSMARARVEELKKSQVAAIPPPSRPVPPAPSQREKKASSCSERIAGSWDVSTAVTFPAPWSCASMVAGNGSSNPTGPWAGKPFGRMVVSGSVIVARGTCTRSRTSGG